MPPVAAIGGALAGAGGAAAGAAGGLAGSLGGVGSAISGIGSIAGQLGSLGGGGGGGADPAAAMQAQILQAQLANKERQRISDRHFRKLIGKRGKGKRAKYGRKNELLFGQKAKDVFGKRPNYYEVDFETMLDQDAGLADLSRDVTRGNLRNFGENAQLADAVNTFLTADAKKRIGAFDPYLLGNIEQTGRNAALASQGILSSADQEALVSNRNEAAGLFGTAGTSRGQVARDLGLQQLDLRTRVAPQLNAQNAALINAFVPAAMRDDPRSSQVSQQQAIQVGAADNQFEATFDRNEQNLRSMLEAMPDPQAQGLFNLQNTLRSQQFAIDFGLANGFGAPGTLPDNLGEGGMAGFGSGAMGVGNALSGIASFMGGGQMSSPGLFG